MDKDDLSGLKWHKSTYSGNGASCVEVAFTDGGSVAARDTKNRTGPMLVFGAKSWSSFLGTLVDKNDQA